MIILSALYDLSARPKVFPILGIIAILLALLGYVSFFFFSKVAGEKHENLAWYIMNSFWVVAYWLSIYGIIAGIVGLNLFIISLAMAFIPYLLLAIFLLMIEIGFRDGI